MDNATFIATFQQLENLLGCGEKQKHPEETIISIMKMIEWKFPLRGLDIFSKAMTDYAAARLSVKPSFDTFVHPALGFPLIATCLAEVNAREAAKERERAATENNDFAPPQRKIMTIEAAEMYFNQLWAGFENTPEHEPIWILWQEAMAIVYKTGALFEKISAQRCEEIAAECQAEEMERCINLAVGFSDLRVLVRSWNQYFYERMTYEEREMADGPAALIKAAGSVPESLKKAASIRTIKAILTEIKNERNRPAAVMRNARTLQIP